MWNFSAGRMPAHCQSDPSLAEQLLPALTDTAPPLTAAGTSTEESRHSWESIRRLGTSQQTNFRGKAADTTMTGCHLKPQGWPIVHRKKLQEHREMIRLRSVMRVAHGRRVKGRSILSKGLGEIPIQLQQTLQNVGVFLFFSFQKKLDRQQENTMKSLLPFSPSETNSSPNPQKPGSSPIFSSQCSWAPVSSPLHLPPSTTGQGT